MNNLEVLIIVYVQSLPLPPDMNVRVSMTIVPEQCVVSVERLFVCPQLS